MSVERYEQESFLGREVYSSSVVFGIGRHLITSVVAITQGGIQFVDYTGHDHQSFLNITSEETKFMIIKTSPLHLHYVSSQR